MKRKALLNVAASSLIVAVTMVGCSGAAMNAHPALATAQADKVAASAAQDAERALAKRNAPVALAAAEAAVAAKPDNADYRSILGRAYLADGRFQSAETAFQDAMTLGHVDARTVVSLALAKVALGKSDAARALLSEHMDILPAADYGLAMAMAGDPQEAVRILSQAVQSPDATAKTRQNLAYAYALSGEWRDARMMAGQDLDPQSATQRIVGWAQTAEKGAESARIAAFIGTTMRTDDSGLPARLALVQPVAAPVQAAEAAPAPTVEVAAATPEVTAPAADAPAPVVVAEAPVIHAPESPARQPVLASMPRTVRDAVKPILRQVALIQPVAGAAASPWVVQLGAYDSAAIAKERWHQMARTHNQLASFSAVNTTIRLSGKEYYRLAVTGFGGRSAADQMCHAIRAQRGNCFVRTGTPGAKVERWAAAAPKRQQIASR